MTKAMESAAADEVKKMRRYMGVLDTMITVARSWVPGTYRHHQFIRIAGQDVIDRPETVAIGIAQALITTATGLIIAIPAVFLCNYFNSRIEDAVLSIEKYATSLEIVYKKLIQHSGQNQEAAE